MGRPDTSGGVKAVEVAGRILEILASTHAPMALRELAQAGRMSPGKVHRYLSSFLSSGLARQNPDTRRYELGPLALRLGLAALSSYQPLREAIAFQRELRNRLDETLVLSVWSPQGPTVVHVEESSQPIIMTIRIGAVLPLLSTATGIVFAAFLPGKFTQPLVRASLQSADKHALLAHSSSAIETLLTEVRSRGFAYNEGHLMPTVCAAAFPLFDRTGALLAVLAAMGTQNRIGRDESSKAVRLLKEATSKFNPLSANELPPAHRG
jgi:DNA-binding IclR family transcriptional regulator